MIESVHVLSIYAKTMARLWPRLLPTFKAWLLIFSMLREFQLYGVYRSDNLEKSDRKGILS